MSAGNARGFGAGPVFVYEWVTASRRWQGYALRFLFVLSLLAAILVIAIGRGETGVVAAGSALRSQAQLGEGLFVAVIGTQLTLVLLAAPAATAGAICLDRSRGTLTHLLVTDLTDREIVLGKLAARLAPILTLVAAALPVMELLTLLGGVDPDALLMAFVVTLGLAILGCALALVFSIWARRTHEALLATYAVWGLWFLAGPILLQTGRATGRFVNTPPDVAIPYVLAFAPYWRPNSVDWWDYVRFLAITCGISAILALIAVLTMRRACTRDVRPKAPHRHWRPVSGVGYAWRRAFPMLDAIGPTLDFNPVFWREWHRNRPPRWAGIVAALFIVIAASCSVMAIVAPGSPDTAPFVNAFQIAIGLLFLSVGAATSLAEERVRGSLDVLMTTPLMSWEIVVGKWLGTYRLVPLLAVLPALVVVGIAKPNEEHWRGVLLMVAFVLAAGAAITSLGLAMATWCPRLGRAVGLTVSLYLLVTVGWMFLIMAIYGWSERGLMMGSPWFWSGMMTAVVGQRIGENVWAAAYCWTLAHVLAALVLLSATLATFDRCLGRVGSRPFPRDRTVSGL